MTSQSARLEIEKRNLLALADACSNVQVEVGGTAMREYKLTFLVQSIADLDSAANELESCDQQEVELDLPLSYPKDPPQMRWLSPIFHPNVSLSGYLDTRDIGLEWAEEMSLLVICERLWDISRFAWVDLDSANNYSAKRKWSEGLFEVPTDPRPLKDDVAVKLANVISYEARTPSAPVESGANPARTVDPESVYSIADSGTSKSVIEPELVEPTIVGPGSEQKPQVAENSGSLQKEWVDGDSPEEHSSKEHSPEDYSPGRQETGRDTESAEKSKDPDAKEESPLVIDPGDVFVIDDKSSSRPPKTKPGDDDIFIIE